MFEKLMSAFRAVPAPVVPLPIVQEIPDGPLHPFYPLGVELSNYVANNIGVLELLVTFLGGWAIILSITWVLVAKFCPQLKPIDKWALMWFVLTGSIHFFFEGYFAYNHWRMPTRNDYFGQLWKEYALSDSRYLTSEPFVLCMETVTAVMWGPLSFVTVGLIASRHPLRYMTQLVVCMGQLYGLILYYATALFESYYKGLHYCRPEGYYFWFYFFFMNFIWMVIPGALMYQSISKATSAFRALDRINDSVKANGAATKLRSNGHIKSS